MAGRDVGEDHGVCTARIIYGTAVFETGIIAVTVKDRSESAGICDGRCISLCGTGMADRNF